MKPPTDATALHNAAVVAANQEPHGTHMTTAVGGAQPADVSGAPPPQCTISGTVFWLVQSKPLIALGSGDQSSSQDTAVIGERAGGPSYSGLMSPDATTMPCSVADTRQTPTLSTAAHAPGVAPATNKAER